MKVARNAVYGCLALLLVLVLPGRAAHHAAAVPPLDGLWKGPLQMPGGKLEVIFRLVKLSSGEYFANLDVPLQKASHLAVTVETRADTVIFTSAEADSRYVGRLSADGQTLQGVWRQTGFQVPLTLTHSALPVEAASAVKSRFAPPYREEEIAFPNPVANLQLAGVLTVPAGPGPFPAVALLSDEGPHDRNGTASGFGPLGQLADYLTRRGVAVLRFDDRGTGHSTGPAPATPASLVSDAQAALTYLRQRPEVDAAHLGLIGLGEGSNVALLAAAQPLPPAFLVGLSAYGEPGTSLAMQQREANLRAQKVDPKVMAASLKRQQQILEVIRQTVVKSQAQTIVATILKQDSTGLSAAAAQARAAALVTTRYREFLKFDPTEKLAGVSCPVLLLYGADDAFLNPDTNLEALLKGLKNNKLAAGHKVAGTNHSFQAARSQWPIVGGEAHPIFSPAAQEDIRAWIVEQTKK
ncbi:alpha/beta hydrolase [Hymenobacter arcticus]